MASKQEEKQQKILRQLLQLPENKKCADCTAKGPVYANITFNTFVCTTCSGIHREFNHRVKSISMATFKPEEIKNLQEGGNKVAAEKWLKLWTPEDFKEPDSNEPERIRQFIRLKYIDKRWIEGSTAQIKQARTHVGGFKPGPQTFPLDPRVKEVSSSKRVSKNEELPNVEPLTNILGGNIPPILVSKGTSTQPSSSKSNFSVDTSLFGASNSNPSEQSFPDFGSFPSPPNDTIMNNASSSQQTRPTVSTTRNELESILMPAEISPQQQQVDQQKKALNLQAQLGQLYQQQQQQRSECGRTVGDRQGRG